MGSSCVFNVHQPPQLNKQNPQNSFVISTMDQLDHNAGLQGAPRELPRESTSPGLLVPRNPCKQHVPAKLGHRHNPNTFPRANQRRFEYVSRLDAVYG